MKVIIDGEEFKLVLAQPIEHTDFKNLFKSAIVYKNENGKAVIIEHEWVKL